MRCDKDDKNLESAQKNQKKIRQVESNPENSGRLENLREEDAEMTDEEQDKPTDKKTSINQRYSNNLFLFLF